MVKKLLNRLFGKKKMIKNAVISKLFQSQKMKVKIMKRISEKY